MDEKKNRKKSLKIKNNHKLDSNESLSGVPRMTLKIHR